MARAVTRFVGVSLAAASLQIALAVACYGGQQAPRKVKGNDPATRVGASHSKQQFGAPETLVGTINMVKPGDRLVVVTRTGPGEPKSPNASWTQTVARGTNEVVDKSQMTMGEGDGETDYAFKITDATVIQVKGRKVSLKELAASLNQPTRVRFTARRDGDFALSIDVGP